MIKACARSCRLIYCISLWIWLTPLSLVSATQLDSSLSGYISRGGFIVTANGSIVSAFNQNTPFIPASTIKLATALVALEILGPDYRFETAFFLDDKNVLYMKGYGDPFLTSEYIDEIASAIKERGIRSISKIILDTTAFALSTNADGSGNSSNPYDAPNSAIAVNFNTLPLVKLNNSITSGEPQTPLLPIMKEIGNYLGQGQHRVNVSAFKPHGILPNSLQYTAELFQAIFSSKGINVKDQFHAGKVDEKAHHIYTYLSEKTVAEMVKDCLKYSNNFMANQLFLSCGAVLFGYPASWEKARKAWKDTLRSRMNIDTSTAVIIEGSGLSPENRITPATLISVLESFKPYASLLPVKNEIYLKSGTLTGVYCYAGYFQSRSRLDPFAILLNQNENNRNQVLKELYAHYQARVTKEEQSRKTGR